MSACTQKADFADGLDGRKCYGKVLITPDNIVLLHCTLCNSEHKNYQKFLEHIFAHHYADKGIEPHHNKELVHKTSGSVEQNNQVDAQPCLEGENSEDEQIPTNLESQDDIVEELCGAITEESADTLLTMKPPTVPNQTGQAKEHNKNSDYKCHICGAVLKNKQIKQRHLVRHTDKKPFPCKECEMKFFTRTELNLHMRRHTGERPFVCSYCGQSFTKSTSLYCHERAHSNTRTHKCNVCDKRFLSKYAARNHMVVHTKEKNHICNICNGKFATRKSLMQHMLLHEDTPKYACNLCNKAFKQKPALWSHKRNRHKLVVEKGKNKSTSDVGNVEFCQRCQMNFENKALLLEHHLQMHAYEDKKATIDALEEMESESMQIV